MITGLYVSENSCRKVRLDGELKSYYKLLDCDYIEAPEFEIDGEMITVICDEEGLYKENTSVRIYNEKFQPLVVGSVFLCKADYKTGEFISLEDETIKKIIANCLKMAITERGVLHVLVIK